MEATSLDLPLLADDEGLDAADLGAEASTAAALEDCELDVLLAEEDALAKSRLQHTLSSLRSLLLEESDDLAQYARLAAFTSLILLGYGTARLASLAGLPSDAVAFGDGGACASDLAALAQLGFVTAVLTGVHTAPRFRWLAQRPAFAALFLLVCFLFGALNEIRGLQVSLSDVGDWGVAAWVALPLGLAACLLAVVWHVLHVRRTMRLRARLAYLGARCGCLLFLLLQFTILRASPPGRRGYEELHLHHYYLGFLIAIWAAFDHWISGCLLAVGCGLLAQGVGAYHSAGLFQLTGEGALAEAQRQGCQFVALNGSVTQAVCSWAPPREKSRWGLQVCPWGGGGWGSMACGMVLS
jgi:hypothetical protein